MMTDIVKVSPTYLSAMGSAFLSVISCMIFYLHESE